MGIGGGGQPLRGICHFLVYDSAQSSICRDVDALPILSIRSVGLSLLFMVLCKTPI